MRLPLNGASDEEPSASVVQVTPAMAKFWLEHHNSVNRAVRSVKVDIYARDMAAGKWQLTGESIIFDSHGQMSNGQHRCHAIVKSGCTVSVLVVCGVSPQAQEVMDTGSARSTADALGLRGYKNCNVLSSITRRVLIHEIGYEPSHTEITEWVGQFPELETAASIAVKYAKECGVIPSTVGLSSWIIAQSNGWDEPELFWHASAKLIGLAAGDPILVMRRTFDECRRTKKKLSVESQLSVIIRAYNYRRQGKPITTFFRIESPKGGPVPVPQVVR